MSIFGEAGDERMAALRQRTRSSDGYSRVSSDDEDIIPSLNMHKIKEVPKKKTGCTYSFKVSVSCFVCMHTANLFPFVIRCIMLLRIFHIRRYILVDRSPSPAKQLHLLES